MASDRAAGTVPRCGNCGASHEGWADVHLLVTETGLEFCSTVCLERFEDENDVTVTVVSESGTQSRRAE